jgi:hypothetical protein
MSFDIPYQMRQLASSLSFLYYKRQTTFIQTFGIPEISQDFLPILQKMPGSSKVHVAERKMTTK